MTAYRPAGRWSASAEQRDVGKSGSANPPDRRTLRISRSQMPSENRTELNFGNTSTGARNTGFFTKCDFKKYLEVCCNYTMIAL